MRLSKEQILKGYAALGKLARLERTKAYIEFQAAGEIPKDKPYSDENFYEYIGQYAAAQDTDLQRNDYLVNIYNKLGRSNFIKIIGNRNELFLRGLRPLIPAGDTDEIFYTNLQTDESYDQNEFVPPATKGGELVKSQLIRISNIPTIGQNTNPDKRRVKVVVPYQIIMAALQPALTNGLPNGWPTIFDEQIARSWDKMKFERNRLLVSMFGGKPSTDKWTEPTTTFEANENSFVLNGAVTNAETFQEFLVNLYSFSAEWNGKYSDKYNVAGLDQIVNTQNQSLFIDSKYEAYWKSTNAILFNSKAINIKNNFKNVDFFEFLPSAVKPEAKKIIAILYADDKHPIWHSPFTQGVMRLVHIWPNMTISIYDNYWIASGHDLSKPCIVFYEKEEEAKKDKGTS